MRSKIVILIVVLFIPLGILNAQDVTTVTAKNSDISDNLDLEAVASLFGEAENLEDFENKLNDPEIQISNLDLNNDGVVDYLRVIETSTDHIHLVTIQAVIGKDQYQDVATIDVERDNEGNTQVQVVGDVYMYGPDYIIEPVYVHRPAVVVWFWGPYYRPWYSPYYFGYYPPYYRARNPYPPSRYQRNVQVNINVHNSYRRPHMRRSTTSIKLQNRISRNDYGSKNPDKSFTKRNRGVKNKLDLNNKRKSSTINRSKTTKDNVSIKKQIPDNRKSNSKKNR